MYSESAKRLTAAGRVLSVIAHIILVLGIIALFTLPILGLVIAFNVAIAYLLLIVLAEICRRLAKRNT